jgi:hypothetical protein
MMRHTIIALLSAVLAVSVGIGIGRAQTGYTMQPGETLAVACASGLSGSIGAQAASLVCATLVPTATATSTATATVAPTHTHTPTPPGHPLGWHPPADHEHGEQPPAWVYASQWQPFTQSRESHSGYKGMRATQRNNGAVESYLITHIVTSEAARSHGDHDYQLWVRDSTGAVSYWQGILPFGVNEAVPTSPIIERTTDTGERPIALAERSPTDGCETWYTRPGVLAFDLGWTICGRYQRFDGTIINGLGLYRSADWTLYPDRFGDRPGVVAPTLAAEARVEFGVTRLTFVRTGHDNPGPNVQPGN